MSIDFSKQKDSQLISTTIISYEILDKRKIEKSYHVAISFEKFHRHYSHFVSPNES